MNKVRRQIIYLWNYLQWGRPGGCFLFALNNSILQFDEYAALRASLEKNGSENVLRDFDERDPARIAVTAYEESLLDAK